MAQEPKDTNGNEIRVGDRVAYNQSGSIVEGIVCKVYKTSGISWNSYLFTIQKLNSSDISKVKNPTSILVLNG